MIVRHSFNSALLGTLLLFSPFVEAITYDEAVQRAMLQSPVLRACHAEHEERQGDLIQSGLYENPIFAFSIENVLGNHDWKGWRAAESRYEIAQPIQIGGQRKHQSQAALYRCYAAEAECASTKLQLLNDLKKAFVGVVAAQEFLSLAKQQQDIAVEVLKAVEAKVEAGKVSPLAKNKALLGVADSKLQMQKAHVDLETARLKLSLLWGSSCVDFDEADYPFFQIGCPPPLEECLADIEDHPALIEAYFNQQAVQEDLAFEKSARIPDVVVLVGYKTVHENGDKGMILGASIPLPVFNRNQGNIRRASAETSRAQEEYIEKQLRLETKLSQLHKEAVRAYQEAEQLDSNILQLAHESFTYTREGYEAGKFEYLDLLDAQRTLFEAQERHIEALLNFLEKQADIEYLTL